MGGAAIIGTELRQAVSEAFVLARELAASAWEIVAEARALCVQAKMLTERSRSR